MGSTVRINGKSYHGNSVVVINGRVIIDGVQQDSTEATELVIQGNIGSLETDCSVIVHGDIEGDVRAGGSLNCKNIRGQVNAGGSVNCDNIDGSVNAGGSINQG